PDLREIGPFLRLQAWKRSRPTRARPTPVGDAARLGHRPAEGNATVARRRVGTMSTKRRVPAAVLGPVLLILGALLIIGSDLPKRQCQNGTDCFQLSDTIDSPGILSLARIGPLIVGAYHALDPLDLAVGEGGPGAWATSTVDSTGSVGDYPSALIADAGGLFISFYDVSNGDLKVAVRESGLWTITRVDTAGRVGLYTSLTKVPGGYGIAYFDSTKGDLKYAGKIGVGPWAGATVDSVGVVGMYPSVAARDTNVFISYYDLTNGDLRFAIRSPCHPSCGYTWSSSAVDVVGNVGGYTSQILTATGSGIAYYDFTNL